MSEKIQRTDLGDSRSAWTIEVNIIRLLFTLKKYR